MTDPITRAEASLKSISDGIGRGIAALNAAEARAEKAEAERDAARADLAEAVAVLRKLDVGEGWAAQTARAFLAKQEGKA